MQTAAARELGFEGVILSDDLEMKAVSARLPPEAAVRPFGPGATGVLICSGDVDVQAATLEALVKGRRVRRDPRKRVDDASSGCGAPRSDSSPAIAAGRRAAPQLRGVIGRDEHQAIAAEMAAFL